MNATQLAAELAYLDEYAEAAIATGNAKLAKKIAIRRAAVLAAA